MSKYKGLFTFDVENHRYLPIEQADGLITEMDYHPEPEPLIKDEKIRKAVRAWAEACEIESDDEIMLSDLAPALTRFYTLKYEIDIKTKTSLRLNEYRGYTIDELCGEEEAPEPLEPTYVDLDERIKEKAVAEKLYKGDNDMHLAEGEE